MANQSLTAKSPTTQKYRIFGNSLFYIIPLIVGLIYWLAFFPGVMSYDSVSQWDQLSTFKITDLHPAFHTILMWMLTRVWSEFNPKGKPIAGLHPHRTWLFILCRSSGWDDERYVMEGRVIRSRNPSTYHIFIKNSKQRG
jgi:hypothetical protein